MNLAIDSKPMGTSIFNTFDYSGIQLYGLEHSPLKNNIANLIETSNQKTVKIILKDKLWDNGKVIKPEHYIAALKKINQSTFFNRFILNKLENISFNKNTINFNFKEPSPDYSQILQLPNWAPYLPGQISGKYKIENCQKRHWNLKNIKTNVKSKVIVVESPAMNIHLYKRKEISHCCDTAIPLSLINEDTNRTDQDLFISLAFSKNLGTNTSFCNGLKHLLTGLEFPEYFDSLPRIKLNSIENRLPKKIASDITIAYDDFYPNKLIVKQVKKFIENNSKAKVHIKRDDYYNPQSHYDLKLYICRPLASNNFYKLHQMLTFPASRASATKLKILNTIDQHRKTQADFNFDLYADLNLAYPLFKLPSFNFKKNNPLLKIFEEFNGME